jgi:hypothetical protein
MPGSDKAGSAGVHTDVILLRCTLPGAVDGLPAMAQAWCDASALRLTVQRVAVSADAQLYLYAALVQARPVTPTELALCRTAWQALCPSATAMDLARLALAFDTPGASHGTTQPPPSCAHYVVEMDPEAGWADELFSWYDEEHMPGLAAVPGTIRASRYINRDAAQSNHEPHTPLSAYPYSIACYDLLGQNVLGSPPWLAVRGTAWSDVVRPHFMNTRRTMMAVVA